MNPQLLGVLGPWLTSQTPFPWLPKFSLPRSFDMEVVDEALWGSGALEVWSIYFWMNWKLVLQPATLNEALNFRGQTNPPKKTYKFGILWWGVILCDFFLLKYIWLFWMITSFKKCSLGLAATGGSFNHHLQVGDFWWNICYVVPRRVSNLEFSWELFFKKLHFISWTGSEERL